MSAGLRQWGGAGGRQVLALHCSLAHSGAWEGVAARLGPDFALSAPDLVGHGRAEDHDPGQDLHDQCFEAILPVLPEGRFDLVGHSFGGTLALRLALQAPERIRSLTLIEPVLFAAARGSGRYSAYLEEMAGFADAMDRGERRRATEEFLNAFGAGLPFEAMPAQQQAYMLDRIGLITASNPVLMEDRLGLVARLGEVGCPTALIEGGESPAVISAIQARFEGAIIGAERHVVAGAGHMLPVTHAREVARLLRGFWGRCSDA